MTAFVHHKTGKQWTFSSVSDAETWIGEREKIDPDGVFNGDYTIDDIDCINEEIQTTHFWD